MILCQVVTLNMLVLLLFMCMHIKSSSTMSSRNSEHAESSSRRIKASHCRVEGCFGLLSLLLALVLSLLLLSVLLIIILLVVLLLMLLSFFL